MIQRWNSLNHSSLESFYALKPCKWLQGLKKYLSLALYRFIAYKATGKIYVHVKA